MARIKPLLTIIIPVYNEEENIGRTLHALGSDPRLEIMVVDGGSSDRTRDLAAQHGAVVMETQKGRARQMNAGAEAAQGDILLFLHGDTRLPGGFLAAVEETMTSGKWLAGAFRLGIDGPGGGLRWIAKLANLRARLLKLPYGDQGIFLKRMDFIGLGGYQELPIMEDFCLVRRLRKKGRIRLLAETALTSDRRWRQLGIVRTTLLNQLMVAGFLLGAAPDRLARLYRGIRQGNDGGRPGPEGVAEVAVANEDEQQL